MYCSPTKFWLENPFELFASLNVIPQQGQTLEEQLNTLSRLVIFVWYALFLLNYRFHSIILFVLLFIILFYYIQKGAMANNIQENYDTTLPLKDWKKIPQGNNLKIQSPTQYRFCNDARPIIPDQSYYSTNKALVGTTCNPRVNEPVTIVAPSFATDYWAANDFVPSQINDNVYHELVQSGYIGSSTCNDPSTFDPNPKPITMAHGQLVEGFNTLYPQPATVNPSLSIPNSQPRREGDLIGCGYQPQNLIHNLPVNAPVGVCQQNDVFNEYNKSLTTQMIEPGIYERSQVQNSSVGNIGISYTQQFQPVSCEKDKNGLTFVNRDPRSYQAPEPRIRAPVPEPSNVFDPRTYGYGTTYRNYVDEMTGQPRFYYDDVESVRRPNYISRNNIDHADWMQSYGPMKTELQDFISTNHSRPLAQDLFQESEVKRRVELQERLMNKYNTTVGYQRRIAPLARHQGNYASHRR